MILHRRAFCLNGSVIGGFCVVVPCSGREKAHPLLSLAQRDKATDLDLVRKAGRGFGHRRAGFPAPAPYPLYSLVVRSGLRLTISDVTFTGLRNKASGCVYRTERGETIRILRQGKLVALLVPAASEGRRPFAERLESRYPVSSSTPPPLGWMFTL